MIERRQYWWASFTTLTTLSASATNYLDEDAFTDGPLLFAPAENSYRIRAGYSGGNSSLPSYAQASLGTDRLKLDTTMTRRSDGRWEVVFAGPRSGLASVRLVWVEWDFFEDYGVAVNALEDVPATNIVNGIYLLPDATATAHLVHRLFVQAINADGSVSAITDAGFVSEGAPYFVDGRAHLLENLVFRLRAASQTESYLPAWLYPSGSDFEEMGFLHDDWEDGFFPRSFVSLDNLWPFDVNQWLQGALCWPVHTNIFDWQTNFVTIPVPPVLSQPDPYWIHQGSQVFSNLGVTVSTDLTTVSLQTSFNNRFGLAAAAGFCTNDSIQPLNGLPCAAEGHVLPLGNSITFSNGGLNRYFSQFQSPILSLAGHYFAPVATPGDHQSGPGVAVEDQRFPLPLQENFSVTNQTPLIVTSLGQKIIIGGWAKLSILNGAAGKFGYLGQYFESAFKVATNGVVTTNQTSILSPYGEFFPTEPGPTALVTMPMDTNSNTRGTAVVHVISLNVDGNHDGEMDFSYFGSDANTPNRPFRFWINDDNDSGETGGDDIPGQPSATANSTRDVDPELFPGYGKIEGVRDLVDFFPVYLNLRSLVQTLPPGPNVRYVLKQADSALNVVFAGLTPTNAHSYLTDTNAAAALVTPSIFTYRIPATGLEVYPAFLTNILTQDTGVILVEARYPTTQPLVLEVRQGSNLVAETKLHLSITSVEQMFRQKNLIREVFGGSTGWPDRLNEADVPNEPETNGKNFVFLHGYNVNPNQARGAFAELFKRMYWSGSRAKFYGVTWRGSETQGSLLIPGITPNLQTNVYNAFLTAPKLKLFLDTLTNGPTTVAAHSLGNMVMLSALSDWNAPVDKYFMIDAAVAIEAIDGSATVSTNMIHSDWINYTNRLWASHWFRLFPTNDYRSTLTWSNRLANLPIANIYNFYSSGEEVLRTHTGPTPDFTGFLEQHIVNAVWNGTPPATFTWALQEKLKGRSPFNWILGSTHGGWEFNAGYDNPTNFLHMPPSEAAQLSDNQLRFVPFFDQSFDGDLFFTDIGSIYAQAHRNRILSDAIPALTLPVAANEVVRLNQPGDPHNFDMDDELKNGWPLSKTSEEDQNWHHSDFKDVAYTYVLPLFNKFVELGNLK